MILENIVYNWLTRDGEQTPDDVTAILEENDDIEIALEIWEEMRYPTFTLDDVENEISYFRKKRPDINLTRNEYEY